MAIRKHRIIDHSSNPHISESLHSHMIYKQVDLLFLGQQVYNLQKTSQYSDFTLKPASLTMREDSLQTAV